MTVGGSVQCSLLGGIFLAALAAFASSISNNLFSYFVNFLVLTLKPNFNKRLPTSSDGRNNNKPDKISLHVNSSKSAKLEKKIITKQTKSQKKSKLKHTSDYLSIFIYTG